MTESSPPPSEKPHALIPKNTASRFLAPDENAGYSGMERAERQESSMIGSINTASVCRTDLQGNATACRKTLRDSAGRTFQEALILNQPGTKPEDLFNSAALGRKTKVKRIQRQPLRQVSHILWVQRETA